MTANNGGGDGAGVFTPSQLIAVEEVARNPKQPRREFDAEKVRALAESIRQDGQLQPIAVHRADVVDPDDPDRPCRYVIILGERRWRAMRSLGSAQIEAKVYEGVDATTVAARALVENLHRENLNAMEEADGYAELAACGLTQEEIAKRVNRSRPAVANALRLLTLPGQVRLLIRAGKLTAAHGMALLRFAAWPKVCGFIAARAVEEDASAGELEKDSLPMGWEMTRERPVLAVRLQDAELELLRAVHGSMVNARAALPWLFEEKYRHGGSSWWSMDPEKSGSWFAEARKKLETEQAKKLEEAKATAAAAKAAGKAVPKAAAKVIEAAAKTGENAGTRDGRGKGMTEAQKKERKAKIESNRKRREAAQQALEQATAAIQAINEVRSVDLARIAKWAVLDRYASKPLAQAFVRLGVKAAKLEAHRPVDLVRALALQRVIHLSEEAIKYSGKVRPEVAAYAKEAPKRDREKAKVRKDEMDTEDGPPSPSLRRDEHPPLEAAGCSERKGKRKARK